MLPRKGVGLRYTTKRSNKTTQSVVCKTICSTSVSKAVIDVSLETVQPTSARGDASITELEEDMFVPAESNVRDMLGNETGVDRIMKLSCDSITQRDWRILCEMYSIKIIGGEYQKTRILRNWEESGVGAKLLANIKALKYKEPTRIQRASINAICNGYDVIGIAETGSGKTAAIAIPMIERWDRDRNGIGVYALIISPTRELSQQLHSEIELLSRGYGLTALSIVGGKSIEDQAMFLTRGCNILIATPGRLIDCIERGLVIFDRCRMFVLDEADKMIGVGFEENIRTILSQLSQNHQTIMITATMTKLLDTVASDYMKNPVRILVEQKSGARITQKFIETNPDDKLACMKKIVRQTFEHMIVFANHKKTCEGLERELRGMGYKVFCLHGGKSQEMREKALAGFKESSHNILVASDVAGRGLDIPNVSIVVNYDMPTTIETYTHRVGRTGRAGKTGASVSLVTELDEGIFESLSRYLIQTKQQLPPILQDTAYIPT